MSMVPFSMASMVGGTSSNLLFLFIIIFYCYTHVFMSRYIVLNFFFFFIVFISSNFWIFSY
nr:hypothetical protein Itr_chr04CG16220 [Ipomoea trifida]